MNNKKFAIGIGVLFGISASIFAMIPTTKQSQAAIAVWDEKNIAQAIEMVSKTTQILSDEDKKLALAILNAKKLDGNMILKYVDENLKTSTHSGFGWNYQNPTSNGGFTWGKLDELYKHTGTSGQKLDSTGLVENAWKQRLGDLQSVLNGSTTIAGAAMNEYNREQALDAAYLEAAVTAQKTQEANQDIQTQTNQMVQDSMNAEGETQILQIGNQIAAQNVMAQLMLNRLIARGIQAEASYYQSKNMEKAQIYANEQKIKDMADKMLKSDNSSGN